VPELGEETKMTVRLSKTDRKNVDKIIATGVAMNTAEAIRVALAITPGFLDIWRGLLGAQVDNLVERIGDIAETIQKARSPQELKIVPNSPSMWAGAANRFFAIDENGDEVPDVLWSISRRDLGTITSDGIFTAGQMPSAVQVIARRGDLEARADVHIMPVRRDAPRVTMERARPR